MPVVRCLISGHKAELIAENLEGFRAGLYYDLYACPICNTTFASPLEVDPLIYEQIYQNAADLLGYSRYYGYARTILEQTNPLQWLARKETAYRHVRNFLATHPGKSPSILEVGSGLGYLTYAMRKEGFNAQGMDISEHAVKDARQRFGEHYIHTSMDQLAQRGLSFDIIIALEVLEHVTNPLEFIQSAAKLLNKEGKILVTTPNRDAFSVCDTWRTDLPPIHLWWFSSTSLRFLADRSHLYVEFPSLSQTKLQRNPPAATTLLDPLGRPMTRLGLMERVSLLTEGHFNSLKRRLHEMLYAQRQKAIANESTRNNSDVLAAIFAAAAPCARDGPAC